MPKDVPSQFAVCINNEGYPASLEFRKLYEVVPDEKAEQAGFLRVVDESGEDYLYPAARFVRLSVPMAVRQALAVTAA
jgi:hypothetical protein